MGGIADVVGKAVGGAAQDSGGAVRRAVRVDVSRLPELPKAKGYALKDFGAALGKARRWAEAAQRQIRSVREAHATERGQLIAQSDSKRDEVVKRVLPSLTLDGVEKARALTGFPRFDPLKTMASVRTGLEATVASTRPALDVDVAALGHQLDQLGREETRLRSFVDALETTQVDELTAKKYGTEEYGPAQWLPRSGGIWPRIRDNQAAREVRAAAPELSSFGEISTELATARARLPEVRTEIAALREKRDAAVTAQSQFRYATEKLATLEADSLASLQKSLSRHIQRADPDALAKMLGSDPKARAAYSQYVTARQQAANLDGIIRAVTQPLEDALKKQASSLKKMESDVTTKVSKAESNARKARLANQYSASRKIEAALSKEVDAKKLFGSDLPRLVQERLAHLEGAYNGIANYPSSSPRQSLRDGALMDDVLQNMMTHNQALTPFDLLFPQYSTNPIAFGLSDIGASAGLDLGRFSDGFSYFTPGQVDIPQFSAPSVPEFQIPDFQMPEFKMPDFSMPDFSMPKFDLFS